MFSPNQDVIFQEVKLFIEGVQVPFTFIQVTSGLGQLPSASISLPPFPGLMDICRYYQPKVHIFYTDQSLDYKFKEGSEKETEQETKGRSECVLFIGHISGVSFSKSRAGGSSQITFSCTHKNALMQDVLVDFTDPVSNSVTQNDTTTDSSIKMNAFSSEWAAITALQGIKEYNYPPEVQAESRGENANEAARLSKYSPKPTAKKELAIELANSDAIQAEGNIASPSIMASKWDTREYHNRYKGFPGVLMNLWNQLKLNPVRTPLDFESMVSLYLPLIEDGIKFFDRLSGHYFVENLMENNRVEPCDTNVSGVSKDDQKHLVPPCNRLFVQSSVQSQITFMTIQQQMGFSGELTDFLSMFRNLLDVIDYELITLTSPAETFFNPGDLEDEETQALETIIKPQLPFYYSPTCNVYYPYMYHTINVSQEEASIPTRITLFSNILPTAGSPLHKNYRAPYSVREAIVKGYAKDLQLEEKKKAEVPATANPSTAAATPTPPTPMTEKDAAKLWKGQNLIASTDGIKNKTRVGKFEFGRGIRHRKYALPFWLSLYPVGASAATEVASTSVFDKEALDLLRNAWDYRFGKEKSFLNPYSPDSGILPHERLLFSSADYRFTKEVAASRAGSLSGIFNPYIIPGYPMDIMDPNPVNPCFHAMCASVTHSISARSIQTDVQFVAAITYTELANYYLQFVNPWLQVAMKIVAGISDTVNVDEDGNKTYTEYTNSIVMNAEAAKVADEEFYWPTLGVGALAPDELYDFETGKLKSIQLVDDIRHGENREENPMLSAQGNLQLVWRPIETREKVETRFGLTFIDMEQNNYNPNVIKYTDEALNDTSLLEPGESQFLDYPEAPGTIEEDNPDVVATETIISSTEKTQTTITNTKGSIEKKTTALPSEYSY